MTFVLLFKAKGKTYRREYKTVQEAESARLYVKLKGATDITIKAKV